MTIINRGGYIMSKGKFYITTAIAYTSRKPHIGNSYEIVMTDAIARYKRLQGYDVFFQTGTDEHGQKIEEIAAAEGITPKQHVDRVAGEIRKICDLLNTTYDKFIRTTDPDHERVIQKILKSSTIRVISIRVTMRECTAPPASPFGQNHSSLTASALTAAERLSLPVKRRISSSFQNIRNS